MMIIDPSCVLRLDKDRLYYTDSKGYVHGQFASDVDMARYAEFHERAMVIRSNNSSGTIALLSCAAFLEGIGEGARSFFRACAIIAAAIVAVFVIMAIGAGISGPPITPEQQIKYERMKQDTEKFIKEVTTDQVQSNNATPQHQPKVNYYKPPKSQIDCTDFNKMPKLYEKCVQGKARTIRASH